MRTILFVLALLVAPAALAQSGSSYDWRSGNSYNWHTSPGGTTHLRGYNLGTGSTWNRTMQPNGSMRGYDSRGNHWQYNSGTGIYQNFGTGTTCVGKGAARTCF